jgi:hypothetical protein
MTGLSRIVWLRVPPGVFLVVGRSGARYEPDTARMVDVSEPDADALIAAHADFEVIGGRLSARDRRIRAQIDDLLAAAVKQGG